MNKLVSVIMPTFNGGKTIGRALDSVLKQDYDNIEIIVVIDPATTDNTKEVLEKLKTPKLKVLTGDRKNAASYLRNKGIHQSMGEYIAFLDDDDGWLPSKVSKQVRFLERNSEYCSVISNYAFKTENKEEVFNTYSNEYAKDILLGHVKVAAGSNLMVRREALFKINLFDDRFEGHQDLEIAIRLDIFGKIGHIDETLVTIFGRSGRVASNAGKLERVKNMYLSVFRDLIESYPKKVANEIYARSWLQVARAYAFENNRDLMLSFLKKSLKYKLLFSKKFKIIPFETYFLIAYYYIKSVIHKNESNN